jgi:hypothetical protein
MELDHIVATVTLEHIGATKTLNTIVVFDIIVASIIPLVSLPMLSPIMWRKEHL